MERMKTSGNGDRIQESFGLCQIQKSSNIDLPGGYVISGVCESNVFQPGGIPVIIRNDDIFMDRW